MHSPAQEQLSVRQAEIAALVARGKSTREIADALHLSPRTIETHILAIFNKTGVRSRVELMAALLRPEGWDASATEGAWPLRSVDAIPNNLPRKLTSFIGREQEIAAIRALVESQQLVTLVGSAGVGKSTTSLHVAATMLAAFNDGVWFIELAPLMDGNYIPATVARVLNIRLSVDGAPLVSLIRQLKAKQALLIFDNCEHLIEPAAATIAAILRDCNQVKILASSREHLRIIGELAFRMPSLAFPRALKAGDLKASEIHDYEAVRLFIDRASAVDNRFALSDDNASSVGEICRRLDGIPLAIELAAARIAILSPQQLRAQLDERFRILTGGSRDAVPRHRTLRALIDWSHDLLDERERSIFRRLGIFVDGFTFEGAAAVAAEMYDKGDVFDVLGSLVEKSLVLAEPAGDTLRFRLLESTRVYALERLESENEYSLVARLHLRYLRDRFADLWAEARRTGRMSVINGVFAVELGNLRSALDRASLAADLVVAAELLVCLHRNPWLQLGLNNEAIERHRQVLFALPENHLRLIASLSGVLADLLGQSGRQVQGLDVASAAVAHARASGDGQTLAWNLSIYAWRLASRGMSDDAERALADVDQTACDPIVSLYVSATRAFVKYASGDYESAVCAGELMLEECRSLCDAPRVRLAAFNLARFEFARGNVQRAITLARDTILACRSVGDGWLLSYLLRVLAASLASSDDRAGAAAAADEAIKMAAGIEPDGAHTAIAIAIRAQVFALSGKLALAGELEGYATAAFRRHGHRLEPYESMVQTCLSATLQSGLGPVELEHYRARGATLSGDEAVALALGN